MATVVKLEALDEPLLADILPSSHEYFRFGTPDRRAPSLASNHNNT